MSNDASLPPRADPPPAAAPSSRPSGRRIGTRALALLGGLLLLGGTLSVAARAATAEPPPPGAVTSVEERWATLRAHYFGDAEIHAGEDLLALDAPGRAHDAAVVPVAVRALDPARAIRRVHLIVDKNPLPLAGIFTFADAARGWQTLETRIRINEYTTVRAVAELEDGSLAMVSRFVKASGGCSAPAMGDLDAALARAGRMKVLLGEARMAAHGETEGASPLESGSAASRGGALVAATIKISHPNNSGMQFDQVSRNYIPAFFVRRIGAELGGVPLLDVETNFSLSENPVIALHFPAEVGEGALAVHALDSKDNRYEASTPFASGS